MSGLPKVIEGLHGQIAKHLAKIRELTAQNRDLTEENERLSAKIERLERDNRWLEDQLFDAREDG